MCWIIHATTGDRRTWRGNWCISAELMEFVSASARVMSAKIVTTAIRCSRFPTAARDFQLIAQFLKSQLRRSPFTRQCFPPDKNPALFNLPSQNVHKLSLKLVLLTTTHDVCPFLIHLQLLQAGLQYFSCLNLHSGRRSRYIIWGLVDAIMTIGLPCVNDPRCFREFHCM